MTIEEINSIVDNYEGLLTFIKDRLKFMEKFDGLYSTGGKIDNIEIYNDKVNVTTWYNMCGYTEHESFNFPLVFLTYDDDKLSKAIGDECKARLQLEEKRKEEEKIKDKLAKEQRELAEYQRLKNKFDIPII